MKNTSSLSMWATTVALCVVFGTGSARADDVTDIAIPYQGGLTFTGSHSWSSALDGSVIAGATTSGNQSTGITFSDWNGQFNETDEIASSPTVITFSGVALTADAVARTLINSSYTAAGDVITFGNSNGDTESYTLVGGSTYRDYYNGLYINDLTGGSGSVTAQNWWTGTGTDKSTVRLDVQTYVLPTSWAGTDLTSITIGIPNTGGEVLLSALQVDDISQSTSPVPEPSSLALLGTGVLGVVGAARKRLAR